MKSHNNLYYPNSYIIGSQENTPFIQEYKRILLLLIDNIYLYNIKIADNSDILSYLIKKLKPSQFHFGTEYDGSYNSKLEKIPLSSYMGTYEIDFHMIFYYKQQSINGSLIYQMNNLFVQTLNSSLSFKRIFKTKI